MKKFSEFSKKQKVLTIVGGVLAVIIITICIMMGVCAGISKADGTVPSGTLSLIGNLLEIGFHLPEPPRRPYAADSGASERRISELLFYLDSMYVQPVTVEDALEITGMSRSSFHLHFQQATGQTFCQYLNDLRLAVADHLIRDGVPPDEAAKRSGFTSRSNYYQQRRNRRPERD